MTGWGWVAIGVLVWFGIAAVAAVLVGRAIRFRDRQVPQSPVEEAQGVQRIFCWHGDD